MGSIDKTGAHLSHKRRRQALPTDPLDPKGKPAERALKRDNISEEDYNYLVQELDIRTENALGYHLK